MAAAIWSQKDMRSPSGGKARHRGGTQAGKAPPSPEMSISGLTESGLSGKIMTPIADFSPALPDVRPAPQAGCFVSKLQVLLRVANRFAPPTIRHRGFSAVKHVVEVKCSVGGICYDCGNPLTRCLMK